MLVQAIAELIKAEDTRAIGEVNARYDIVTVIVEIAASVLYDLDYTSTDSDHTSCPALNFITGALRPWGRGGGEFCLSRSLRWRRAHRDNELVFPTLRAWSLQRYD